MLVENISFYQSQSKSVIAAHRSENADKENRVFVDEIDQLLRLGEVHALAAVPCRRAGCYGHQLSLGWRSRERGCLQYLSSTSRSEVSTCQVFDRRKRPTKENYSQRAAFSQQTCTAADMTMLGFSV